MIVWLDSAGSRYGHDRTSGGHPRRKIGEVLIRIEVLEIL
jgi:hypothetical protein